MNAPSPLSARALVPTPTDITVHAQSRQLEVSFNNGQTFKLPFELLRVFSPSAEVKGHGPGQEILQTGKRDVRITQLESVGHYAVQPTFSDGHSTGIYTWEYLHHLGEHQVQLWADHEAKLAAAGVDRDQPMPGQDAGGCGSGGCGSGGCGSH